MFSPLLRRCLAFFPSLCRRRISTLAFPSRRAAPAVSIPSFMRWRSSIDNELAARRSGLARRGPEGGLCARGAWSGAHERATTLASFERASSCRSISTPRDDDQRAVFALTKPRAARRILATPSADALRYGILEASNPERDRNMREELTPPGDSEFSSPFDRHEAGASLALPRPQPRTLFLSSLSSLSFCLTTKPPSFAPDLLREKRQKTPHLSPPTPPSARG